MNPPVSSPQKALSWVLSETLRRVRHPHSPARQPRAVAAMAPRRSLYARALLALLVVCAPGRISQGWGPATAHAWAPREVLSTNDLAANAYPAATHVPCVLLLNATGSVGCSTSAGGVTAPLRRFQSLADVRSRLKSRTILLLPASAFPEVLSDYAKGAGWKTHAAGFMLEPGVDADGNPPEGEDSRDTSIRSEPLDGHSMSTSGATLARLLAGIQLGANPSFSPQSKRGDLESSRIWNPGGFEAAQMRFENTPIVLLDAKGADVARTFAAANGARGTSRVAELRFPMAAAAAATEKNNPANPAKLCLEQRTCQPIGGHSVVASVPASPEVIRSRGQSSNVSEESDDGDDESRKFQRREYLLVSARLDATALFHDAAFGANAAMSGLMAMLAIAKTYADAIRDARASLASLSSTEAPSASKENESLSSEAFERALSEDAAPVAFAAFGAEAWGRTGSRRFARLARDATRLARENDSDTTDSHTSDASTANADALPLWMRRRELGGVVDLGAVGFSHVSTTATLFAHANEEARRNTGNRDGTSSFPRILESLEESFAKEETRAGTNASRRLSFARASAAPELPPSSASSFNSDDAVPAVVLAEYDGAYVDGTFGSAFDVGMEKVDLQKMASLVSGVADALASLAFSSSKTNPTLDDEGGEEETETLRAARLHVSANIPDFASVEKTTRELAECLIDPNVGFQCALAKRLFAPKETFPSRYAGVAPTSIGNRKFDAESDGKDGAGADDVARFVFEFLAEATAESAAASSSAASCASFDACGDGEVCAFVSGDGDVDEDGDDDADGDDAYAVRLLSPRRALLGSDAFGDGGGGAGTCVTTSARFLPALSSRVFFDDDENRWTVSDAELSDDGYSNEDQEDPLWCESDWPTSIGARVFRVESALNEWVALLFGAAVTFLAALFADELENIARTRFKEE